jgi:hypothetical protein
MAAARGGAASTDRISREAAGSYTKPKVVSGADI